MLHHGVVVHNRVNAAKKSKTEEKVTKRESKTGYFKETPPVKEKPLQLPVDPVDPAQAKIAVQQNADAPAIQGMLKKRAASLYGFGPAVWHDRYILLDPSEGMLSYWESGDIKEWAKSHMAVPGMRGWEPGIIGSSSDASKAMKPAQAPKRTFMLKDIVQVESNSRHCIFQVVFCNEGKHRDIRRVLHLKADEWTFNQWVEALRPYGMRKGPTTPSAKKRDSNQIGKRSTSSLR